MEHNSGLKDLFRGVEQLKDRQIFFVMGVPGSGAMWVQKILDTHSNIICKSGGHFLDLLEPKIRRAVAGYNAQIPAKGNWSRHRRESNAEVEDRLFTYSKSDTERLLIDASKLMLVKWSKDKEDVKYVGDYSPENHAHLSSLLRLFPAARFIHFVRDVRDVIVSGWLFNLTCGRSEFRARFPSVKHYAVTIAKDWTRQVFNARKIGQTIEDRYLELYYENLLRDPITELLKLLNFFSVDASRNTVCQCLQSAEFSSVGDDPERPLQNGVTVDWKNHLDQGVIAEIWPYCGALSKDLGYE
jgi:hypothetical protein